MHKQPGHLVCPYSGRNRLAGDFRKKKRQANKTRKWRHPNVCLLPEDAGSPASPAEVLGHLGALHALIGNNPSPRPACRICRSEPARSAGSAGTVQEPFVPYDRRLRQASSSQSEWSGSFRLGQDGSAARVALAPLG